MRISPPHSLMSLRNGLPKLGGTRPPALAAVAACYSYDACLHGWTWRRLENLTASRAESDKVMLLRMRSQINNVCVCVADWSDYELNENRDS